MTWYREDFVIKISTRKNKKYDVYQNEKYVCSFGQKGYQQYHDKFGYYSDLDHHDPQRRKAYKARFKKLIDKNDDKKPTYWSNKFLW